MLTADSFLLRQEHEHPTHSDLIHDDLAGGTDGEVRNLVAVHIPGRGDRIAKRRPLMRIWVIEGGEMPAILPVEKKDFPLHVELVHRLKRSADQNLWRSILVDIGTLGDHITETGIRSGHRVVQGKEHLAIRTTEDIGR